MSVPEAQHDNRPACAACKHQRRKCAEDCVFAEHFPEDKTEEFKAALDVFGVKNMTKIIKSLGSNEERKMAVASIVWEAKAWKVDPVNGPLGTFRRYHDQLALQGRASPLVTDSLMGVSNANEGNHGYMEHNLQGPRIVKFEQQGPSCDDVNNSVPLAEFNPFRKFADRRSMIDGGGQGTTPVNVNNYHIGFNQTQVIGGQGSPLVSYQLRRTNEPDGSSHEAMLVHCRPNSRLSSIVDVQFQGGCFGNYVGFAERLRQGQGRENGIHYTNSIIPLPQANNEGQGQQ